MIIAPGHLHGTVTDSRELISIRTLCTMLATCLEQILRQSVALCWSRLQSNGSFKLLMIDFALYRLCAIQAELLYKTLLEQLLRTLQTACLNECLVSLCFLYRPIQFLLILCKRVHCTYLHTI